MFVTDTEQTLMCSTHPPVLNCLWVKWCMIRINVPASKQKQIKWQVSGLKRCEEILSSKKLKFIFTDLSHLSVITFNTDGAPLVRTPLPTEGIPFWHSALGTINGAGLQWVTDGASIIAQGPSVGPIPPPGGGTDGAAVFAQDPSCGPPLPPI